MTTETTTEAAREKPNYYEPTDIRVPVERIVDAPDGRSAAMFLCQEVGSGSWAGRTFTLTAVIPDGSLVVSFDRQPGDETMLGRDRFILRTHALVEAILAAGAVPKGAVPQVAEVDRVE